MRGDGLPPMLRGAVGVDVVPLMSRGRGDVDDDDAVPSNV